MLHNICISAYYVTQVSESWPLGLLLLLLCFIEILVVNSNSVDPDLSLYCLQVTHLGVSRLKWVNTFCTQCGTH